MTTAALVLRGHLAGIRLTQADRPEEGDKAPTGQTRDERPARLSGRERFRERIKSVLVHWCTSIAVPLRASSAQAG